MNTKYIDLRSVLDNILAHPMLEGVTLDRAADYAANFIRIVGVPNMFEQKVTEVKIENNRGVLPEDFQEMVQCKSAKGNVYVYTTDNFHLIGDSKAYTYKLQGGFIYTGVKEDTMTIVYRNMPVDETGYPMIPENSSFTRALEAYIKKQWFTVLFDMGRISTQVLQQTLQDYAWAVGDCETEFKRLNIDEMEAFMRSWKNLGLGRPHNVGYKYNNR